MRPRKFIKAICSIFLRRFLAYGSYNTLVRQTMYQLNKSMVIWDFECVNHCGILSPLTLPSSGDSVGESWEDSETDYDNWLAQNISTLLPLNHETEREAT